MFFGETRSLLSQNSLGVRGEQTRGVFGQNRLGLFLKSLGLFWAGKVSGCSGKVSVRGFLAQIELRGGARWVAVQERCPPGGLGCAVGVEE